MRLSVEVLTEDLAFCPLSAAWWTGSSRRTTTRTAARTRTAAPAGPVRWRTGVLRPTMKIADLQVGPVSREAMVYSPRTSASEMKQALITEVRMLGSTIRQMTPPHELPSDRAASAQRLHVNSGQPGVQRSVRERQHQDGVGEAQPDRVGAEHAGDGPVDRRQADHQHDRRNGQRQQTDELHDPAQPGQPKPHPGHRRHQQHQHDHQGQADQRERVVQALPHLDAGGVGCDVASEKTMARPHRCGCYCAAGSRSRATTEAGSGRTPSPRSPRAPEPNCLRRWTFAAPSHWCRRRSRPAPRTTPRCRVGRGHESHRDARSLQPRVQRPSPG